VKLETLLHAQMAMNVMFHKLVESGALNNIEAAFEAHGVPKNFSVKFEALIEEERRRGLSYEEKNNG
jgi:hypothetical protein